MRRVGLDSLLPTLIAASRAGLMFAASQLDDPLEGVLTATTTSSAQLGYVPLRFTSSAAALEAFGADPQRFAAPCSLLWLMWRLRQREERCRLKVPTLVEAKRPRVRVNARARRESTEIAWTASERSRYSRPW